MTAGFNWSVLIESAGNIDDLGGGRARFNSGRSGSFPALIRVEAVKGNISLASQADVQVAAPERSIISGGVMLQARSNSQGVKVHYTPREACYGRKWH